MGFLQGKRALIVGVASKRSIAWGIAEAMHREGAELAFTYQTEKLKSRVEQVAEVCNSNIIIPCDVAYDEQIENTFTELKKHWDHYDILVHAVGFAPREQLVGDYMDAVTREGFQIAHDISSYSFVALAQAGRSMMSGRNGALLTLTYMGAVRSMPSYNVMGLAKASLEANVRYMAQSLGPKGIRDLVEDSPGSSSRGQDDRLKLTTVPVLLSSSEAATKLPTMSVAALLHSPWENSLQSSA